MKNNHPRHVLCHDWLTTYGGADQVAAKLSKTLEIRDVFTYAAWPATVSSLFPDRRVRQIGPALANRYWQWFLPHMPRAWRVLDLEGFDLVVTSSHSCVNEVQPPPDAILVSYCHTPMRYAWDWRAEISRLPMLMRPFWPAIARRLRRSDRRRAQRVDLFVANSRFVAERIRSFYGRGSLVVHPPVDTSFWRPDPCSGRKEYFLLSGRLVSYKRPDRVVAAANEARVPLVIAGSGPMLQSLRRTAGSNVRFEQNPSSEQLRELYSHARAFVFGGIEDFGMSIVEAQACGTPVIAVGAGGALDTVIAGTTGILVNQGDIRELADTLRRFDPAEFDPAQIREASLRFDAAVFDEKVRWAIDHAMRREWQDIAEHPDWVAA